jgi:hypothetical protein
MMPMVADPEFASWLQSVRDAVAAVRAASAPKQNREQGPRDKRLDSVLPMQFEHGGRLRWAASAHSASLWSALTELAVYLCGLVAVVFALAAKWIPGALWIGLGIAFVLAWCLHRWFRRAERPAERWRQEAEVVPGMLVYANTVLYAPGPEPAANVGFVLTFDADLAADPARMDQVARRCFELHRADTKARPDEVELQQRARAWSERRTEHDPHRFDRVRVPRSLCGNDATFMTAVTADRRDLPGGVIDRRAYPLLARPGHDESASIVPASIWASGVQP